MLSPLRRIVAASFAALVAGSCSEGGGTAASGAESQFLVTHVDLAPNGVQELDRRITFTFSHSVDFASVSTATIALRDSSGVHVVGEWRPALDSSRKLVFQPLCPRSDHLSDGGLRRGEFYALDVPGLDTNASTLLRSSDGRELAHTVHFDFATPADLEHAYFDRKPGAPRVLVRARQSLDTQTSYVELGRDADRRAYFERSNAQISLDPLQELPLNLDSVRASQVVFVLAFDQSIDRSEQNLARVRCEFRGASGVWKGLAATSTLVENCGELGATLRVEPLGILPPDGDVRLVLGVGFSDRVGESLAADVADFALAHVQAAQAPLFDELSEEFDASAYDGWSASEVGQRAEWSSGRLAARIDLGGTSVGVDDFDLEVAFGEQLLFDTTQTALIGGPGFVPTQSRVMSGGVIEARDVHIGGHAVLRANGPNPLVILATGDVTIDGMIDVSGFDGPSPSIPYVFRGPGDGFAEAWTMHLRTPNSAPVTCGGGAGGGDWPTMSSWPTHGGAGGGAFGLVGSGGEGGAAGWATTTLESDRRGGGGGGGRFGPDQLAASGALFDQSAIGLDAEPGFANAQGAHSAMGTPYPLGGAVGTSPFVDIDPNDDFFGAALDEVDGSRTLGELIRPWAGAGGGRGGDACQGTSFPPESGTIHEIGGGGGGGGGSLRIIALGRITIGATGRIVARGGFGGGGSNSIYLNRVGGAGGGGSGGHVILESARQVVFVAQVPATQRAITATGGQGGAGKDNIGGARSEQSHTSAETTALLDACPPGYPTSGANACKGHVNGAGGDGGPGVIQIHAPNGIAGVVLPVGKSLADLCQPTPLCDWGTRHLEPSVGLRSRAISKWYAFGQGGFDAASGASSAPVVSIGDIDPVSGRVLTENGAATVAAPIFGPTALQNAPVVPLIAHGGYALVFDAAFWTVGPNRRYLERPALLARCVVQLTDGFDPNRSTRFDIVFAERVDPLSTHLTAWLDHDGPSLLASLGAAPRVSIHPAFVRVSCDGVLDALADSASVKLRFQATSADAFGAPTLAMSEFTSNAGTLQQWIASHGAAFLRFDVEFALTPEAGAGASRFHRPALEFLRIPFSY